MLSGNEVRSQFIEFFKKKLHKQYESASLIPDDETLLLTVAGMVPFKPFFLGQAEAPHSRVTTYQKCIRTNDLENVGKTARHHTFFEMLGNFSFGDYFKEEAIIWSWEFVTDILKLDKDKLWISIYKDDDESEKIWIEKVGFPKERIVRLGEEDNWWSAGPVGSCGPCSEIHIDQGEDLGCGPDCKLGCECDSDRYLEIWNLVFTEWNKTEDGSLEPLPKKNIDTGAGLERICAVVQGKKNNYETDLLFPILVEAGNLCSCKYGDSAKKDYSLKVITDHIRAISFLVADGVLPGNEGRAYVLRRILRRAVRHGRLLGRNEVFLCELVDKVIEVMKPAYAELEEKREHIKKIVLIEEEKFSKTLDQGMKLVNEELEKLKENNESKLNSDIVFKLYDTYGFPFELSEEICKENNITISFDEYKVKMKEHQAKARSARETTREKGQDAFIESFYEKHGKTIFEGYEKEETEAIVYFVENLENAKVQIIFDRTVFYAESGGQASDTGFIYGDNCELEILDVQKQKDIFIHTAKLIKGQIKEGSKLKLKIDLRRRNEIKRNHTATHLLHRALKDVLGEHIQQAGSLVTDDRLRFDFTHFEGMSREEIEKVEEIVNEKIFENTSVNVEFMNMDEAKEKGAIALFGDKYGETVRVVSQGEYSTELCGGTHVEKTGEIGLFNILSEQGIASGVRRIEATTGFTSFKIVNQMENLLFSLGDKLKSEVPNLLTKVDKLLLDLKESQKELEKAKSQLASYETNSLFDNIVEINSTKVLIASFKNKEAGSLREIVDKAKDKLESCIVVLGSNNNGQANFAVGVTKDLIGKIKAGALVKEIANFAGGNGGGRPDFAQAGAKEGEKLMEALKLAENILREKL